MVVVESRAYFHHHVQGIVDTEPHIERGLPPRENRGTRRNHQVVVDVENRVALFVPTLDCGGKQVRLVDVNRVVGDGDRKFQVSVGGLHRGVGPGNEEHRLGHGDREVIFPLV